MNDAPVAQNDSGAGFTTDEQTSFETASVLANDNDIDANDVLVVSAIDTSLTTGLASIVGNGSSGRIFYDPNGQFDTLKIGQAATDVVIITVADGNGGTSVSTLFITINGVSFIWLGVESGLLMFAHYAPLQIGWSDCNLW